MPAWYHFILQKDKDKVLSLLKFTSNITHLDYEHMKVTENITAMWQSLKE